MRRALGGGLRHEHQAAEPVGQFADGPGGPAVTVLDQRALVQERVLGAVVLMGHARQDRHVREDGGHLRRRVVVAWVEAVEHDPELVPTDGQPAVIAERQAQVPQARWVRLGHHQHQVRQLQASGVRRGGGRGCVAAQISNHPPMLSGQLAQHARDQRGRDLGQHAARGGQAAERQQARAHLLQLVAHRGPEIPPGGEGAGDLEQVVLRL